MRVRIDLSYDGTDFSGWAAQPGLRTVQAELERALAQVLRRDDLPHLVVAGRTDAGVNARGQVAHQDVPAGAPAPVINGIRMPDPASESHTQIPLIMGGEGQPPLVRRLNGTLPHDIRIRRVALAHPDFDARWCGLSRTYSYRIADRPEAVDPLRRHDTLHWPRPLDLDAMREASQQLVGLHDFAAFCKKREGATTIRTLLRLDWLRDDDAVLIATVQADAFCHSMVRSLMGALIAVGEGRQPATWPASLLSLDSRSSGVLVAPPQGLTLEHVEYPPDDQLAARQLVTRRPRA